MEQKYIIWFAIIIAFILGITIGMIIAQRTLPTSKVIISCINNTNDLYQLRNLSMVK
jgi:uncharacterized membrane-anchored protein YhcB (DUF1043 family)